MQVALLLVDSVKVESIQSCSSKKATQGIHGYKELLCRRFTSGRTGNIALSSIARWTQNSVALFLLSAVSVSAALLVSTEASTHLAFQPSTTLGAKKDVQFTKSETWVGLVPAEWHGSTGPLTVRSYEDFYFGCSKEAAKAATDLGFSSILDMHSPLEPSIGWNKMQYALGTDGTRQSSFRAYLPKTFVNSTQNLHICTRAVGSKLAFSRQTDGRLRTDSVEIQSTDGRHVRVVKARQEFGFDYYQEHLERMGIEVVRHTPGVGANLQDHSYIKTVYNCPLPDSLWAMIKQPWILIREIYNYLILGFGWLLCIQIEVEIFGMASLIDAEGKPTAASAEHKNPFNPNNRPDFAVLATPIADPREPGIDWSKGLFGPNCALMKAESRGRVLLRSRNPLEKPLCEMGYLTHPKDWAALRAALRMRANGYALEESKVPSALDDETLDTFIKERVETMYHYASSCRMASEVDAHPGVVDPELRVHGISNLRISDASVLPSAPAVHPQALIYAVAEKCADMMLKGYEIFHLLPVIFIFDARIQEELR
ncbi:FAD/NAD-P-binding domain-containing protein [Mycena venus]|uniref:FAD/NAD-P-binding domain-containing protein n=1 Tax=Mycena venus TaxID=2733690 RepID=A0A8H6YE21_9AGAR|nr:FAD/NAD-P-binding domain-containing protein [Mycena venus]